STPAVMSDSSAFGALQAGPTVATIFVCRMRNSDTCDMRCATRTIRPFVPPEKVKAKGELGFQEDRRVGPALEIGLHQSLRDLHRFGIGECLVERRERIRAAADGLPRDGGGIALEERERAQEVAGLAPPAAADLGVLAIDLMVRVDRARADVGVVAGDNVAAAVATERESFLD